jgi:hypothetical protein
MSKVGCKEVVTASAEQTPSACKATGFLSKIGPINISLRALLI